MWVESSRRWNKVASNKVCIQGLQTGFVASKGGKHRDQGTIQVVVVIAMHGEKQAGCANITLQCMVKKNIHSKQHLLELGTVAEFAMKRHHCCCQGV